MGRGEEWHLETRHSAILFFDIYIFFPLFEVLFSFSFCNLLPASGFRLPLSDFRARRSNLIYSPLKVQQFKKKIQRIIIDLIHCKKND